MSQPALFHHAPSWQLALLAAAGIAGSGFMAFQAGQPVARLLSAPKLAITNELNEPITNNSRVAGSNSINQPADTVTSLKSQVANLVSRVAELESTSKSDVVLGDSTEAAPSREEFPPAVNLIRNSSFEENSDGAPRQWNYNQWSSSGNTFTTAEAIRTGAAGLKVLGSATTNFGFSQPTTKMVEGRNYALSIWVKPVNTDSHTVKLSFWDEANNKEASAKSFSFTGTKEWSRLVLQISNKNTWNGKKWYPMVTVNGLNQGAVYFDDAQLEEASSYTPYHFEGGGATQSHVSVLGDGSVEIDAHGNVYPAVNGIGSLGTGDNKFSELKLSKATIDKDGSLTLEGDITVNGNGTFKGAFSFTGTIKSHLIPDQDSTYDLGSSSKKWRVGYIDQIHLENSETINNNIDSDITFIENNTGGNNTLVFDMNAAADAVELRNDTEDLRLRAAGNANLVFRAGDAATNSNVDGNDLFLAAEDAMTLRSATYSLQTSGSTITMTALNSSITMSTGSDNQGFINLRSAGTLTLDTTANRTNINVLAGGTSSSSLTLRSVNGGIDISTGAASGAGNLTLRSAGTLLLDTSALGTDLTARSGTGLLTLTSARNNAQAILAEATAGGIDILASAASAGEDIDISATGSSVNLQSTENVDDAITLWTTNGGIDVSTSGVGGLGALVLRSGGSLKLDTSGNNNNVLVDSGTGDLLENVGTNTMSAVDDAINAISLSATRGGINLSSSSASGSGDIKLRSAGTLHLDTSANGTNILANTGTGRLVATSNNAGITAIQLLATNGGVDISTSGVGGLGELRLRAGGSLKLDTSGNNNNILVDSGTGDLLANIGTGTFVAIDDAVAALGLNASRGGITLSSSNANGNGNMILKSGGTLQLSTSANNSNVLLQAGTGAFTVNAGASTHTYTGNYAVTDTAQIGLTSNQAAINAIALLTTNGGIDISTSGVGGVGELRLRSGGSLKIDTSGNNNNILIDSGTGDLLSNIGTQTTVAQDDAVNALALSASRGGIQLSTSSASSNGVLYLKSAGTLVLDTSAKNTNVVVQAGTGAFTVGAGASTHTYTGNYAVTDTAQIGLTSNQAAINAIALLTTNGGIDISTSGVGGVGELRLRSGGSLKLDTSGNNNNILIDSGTGDLLSNIGTQTTVAQDDAVNALALSASRGGIQLSTGAASSNGVLYLKSAGTLVLDTSANRTDINILAGNTTSTALTLRSNNGGIDMSSSAATGAGNITVRSAGTLQLDTSAANSTMLVRTGTGTVDISSGLVHLGAQNDNLNAIRLLADRGGINISSGSASGNGNVTIKSAGTLTLDTSATNANIMLRAGTGRIDVSGNTIVINSGAGTMDLSSNNTIKIVSSTTASLWGEAGTELGRAGQLTTVYGRMCIRGSDGGTACPAGSDGRLFVQVTGEASDDPGDVFDLAEYYPASEAVDPGTVVVADSAARATVKKSGYPYQRVLGVVSTTPAIRINEGSFSVGGTAITEASVKPLIALVGRVPVKVTNENGAIKVGDRLVASSTAGSAMKAVKQGMTLGMALEDADFADGAAEAKVMTFVNVSWYFPEVVDALEKEHQLAQAVGVAPDIAGATADALAAASDPALPSDPSNPSDPSSPAVLGLAAPSLTLAIPPTEFPNIAVADTLTVGKSLIVNGTAKFEGTVEVLSDATFAKSVIIVGNLRIGGNLEIAGAVVTSFTAGSSLSAGDPVSVNSSGQAVKAGGTNAVVGVAAGAAGAGDKVNVAVAGKVGGLSGLAAGSRYYVSESGALTTDGKGGQSVGVAVSSTELLVQPGVGLPAATESTEPSSSNLLQTPLNSSNSSDSAAPAEEPAPSPEPTATPTPTALPAEASAAAGTPPAPPAGEPTEAPAEPTPTPTP